MSRMSASQMHPGGVTKLGSPMGPSAPTGAGYIAGREVTTSRSAPPPLNGVKGPIKHAVEGYNDGDEM